jgi:hypothetical protein
MLLDDVMARRPRRRMVLLAGVVAGVWVTGYYRFLIAPRLPASTDPYWSMQELTAAGAGWTRLAWALRPALGATASIVALAARGGPRAAPPARIAAARFLLRRGGGAGCSAHAREPAAQSSSS